MNDSTIYTIGTALNRAHANEVPVQILVGNEWITGQVVAVDGHGVVLQTDAMEHSVVRMDMVAAVTVFAAAPGQPRDDDRVAIPVGSGVPGPRRSCD